MNSTSTALLQVQGLCKTYTQGRWWQRQFRVPALQDLDLTVKVGGTLALVGESGSGKTTLAMCLVGLEEPDAGDIWFGGANLLARPHRRVPRQEIQLIFQDSAGALNPRFSAGQVIEEPLLIQGAKSERERDLAVSEVMEQVGLSRKWKNRRPHELSGGQRQRLAIARALVLRPRLLILDEAVVGLDLSIRGQVLNLLLDLQASEGLSYLYISHNLELVGQFADEIAVLHAGRIVEQSSSEEVFARPQHPYTQALLAALQTTRFTAGAHA